MGKLKSYVLGVFDFGRTRTVYSKRLILHYRNDFKSKMCPTLFIKDIRALSEHEKEGAVVGKLAGFCAKQLAYAQGVSR